MTTMLVRVAAAIGLSALLTGCVQGAAGPAWTFAPPPPATPVTVAVADTSGAAAGHIRYRARHDIDDVARLGHGCGWQVSPDPATAVAVGQSQHRSLRPRLQASGA